MLTHDKRPEYGKITPSQYAAMNRRKKPFKPPEDKIIHSESKPGTVWIRGLEYEQIFDEKGGWVEIKLKSITNIQP